MMEPSGLWTHDTGVEHSDAAQLHPGVPVPHALWSEAQLAAVVPASLVVFTQNCESTAQKVAPQGNSPGGEA
jgi:hypothetical protein